MELGGHAVGGHDIEADRRQEYAACRASLGVAPEHGLEDARLAGDVEVVRTCTQTPFDHGTARLRVRTGAVQDQAHVADALGDGLGRIEVEDADGQAEARADRLDGFAAPARQNGP